MVIESWRLFRFLSRGLMSEIWRLHSIIILELKLLELKFRLHHLLVLRLLFVCLILGSHTRQHSRSDSWLSPQGVSPSSAQRCWDQPGQSMHINPLNYRPDTQVWLCIIYFWGTELPNRRSGDHWRQFSANCAWGHSGLHVARRRGSCGAGEGTGIISCKASTLVIVMNTWDNTSLAHLVLTFNK